MELVKYNEACRAIDAAKNVDEVKNIRDKSEAIRAYAKQAKNKALEIGAAEIRIRAERRLGEMLLKQKETVGLNTGGWKERSCSAISEPQDRIPTLSESGIDKKLSSRAQKIAQVPIEKFEEKMQILRGAVEREGERITVDLEKIGAKAHVGNNSGENEWYTPSTYIDSAREVMGDITLDPASSVIANKTVMAKKFYTEDDDGLTKKWTGRIWMNPPYAQPLITNFCEKLVSEKFDEAIVLVNNATETRWFQILAEKAKSICFPSGRIRFVSPSGELGDSPLQGQAILYFGIKFPKFKLVFSKYGFVVKL